MKDMDCWTAWRWGVEMNNMWMLKYESVMKGKETQIG